jgi:hypothetical protein
MPTYLAQPLTLALQFCPPPGIYLRWLTPLGEWAGWLFSGDYDPKTSIDDATDLKHGRWPGYGSRAPGGYQYAHRACW